MWSSRLPRSALSHVTFENLLIISSHLTKNCKSHLQMVYHEQRSRQNAKMIIFRYREFWMFVSVELRQLSAEVTYEPEPRRFSI